MSQLRQDPAPDDLDTDLNFGLVAWLVGARRNRSVTSITGRPDNRAAMQNSTAMADRIHRTLSGQPVHQLSDTGMPAAE
jgi:hypothetical protein